MWWTAPSGVRSLVHHLARSGYELGASLPSDADAARARWRRIRAEIGDRAVTGLALLLNGADHHARQRELPEAIAALTAAARPDDVRQGTLGEFVRDLVERAASGKLPEISGELRDSYGYTWTLQGTLASRTPQKRRYALAERELLRDVEPWVALAKFAGGRSRRSLARAAWRPLLLCQPHDTLCGCSIDAVARAMDARLESAVTQAEGLREDALYDLIGHDRDDARLNPAKWKPVAIVRNRAARQRSGVAVIRVSAKLADVPVGPGSAARQVARATRAPVTTRMAGRTDAAARHHRVVRAHRGAASLSRQRRGGPDVVRRVGTDVPAYGVACIPVEDRDGNALPLEQRVVVKGRSVANGRVALRWDGRGAVTLEDLAQRRAVRGLVAWESRRDDGDLYTPAPREKKLTPRHLGTKVIHRGPLVGVVEQRWRFARAGESVDLRVRFALDAGAGFLRIGVIGDNKAANHRLRIVINGDVARPAVFADAAFGTVERARLDVAPADTRMEKPVPTAPLHRYVSLFDARRGVTAFSDGLTEYEQVARGIAITLIRSVGELSRADLRERPGHAGWPAPTPEAQCIGPFEAEFGVLLHGPRTPETVDEIERCADDVLFPLAGETLRSALGIAPVVHGVSLEGRGLAFSAAKESEDGEWLVLRCVNLVDEPRDGLWTVSRAIQEAHIARLDETPISRTRVQADTVPFRAPARGIVTILVR